MEWREKLSSIWSRKPMPVSMSASPVPSRSRETAISVSRVFRSTVAVRNGSFLLDWLICRPPIILPKALRRRVNIPGGMMRKYLLSAAVSLAFSAAIPSVPAFAQALATPPADRAAAEASFAQALEAECAKVLCRKAVRSVVLRMGDGSSFQIATRPLPYFDEKGTLILFAGEAVALAFAEDDEKLEHPILSSVTDPLGPVELSAQDSKRIISFTFLQANGKPDMMLGVSNTTKAMLKYDTVGFQPDVVNSNARGGHIPTCALPPPDGGQTTSLALAHWPEPMVMVMVTNIRAL